MSRSDSGSWVNILVGCTGSVASVKLPQLITQLKELKLPNHPNMSIKVKVVATKHSLHFFPLNKVREDTEVFLDQDEWNTWRRIPDPVLHIEMRRWAHLMVIAPLDANTMAKMANGLCDNLLTCIVRAWDPSRPLLFCPAMNTYMWDHPLTSQHLEALRQLGYIEVPCISKKLACGEEGLGGMEEVGNIVQMVQHHLEEYLEKTTAPQDTPSSD